MWNMRFGELLLFNTTSDCLETAWVSSWGSGLSIWIEIVLWKQGFSFWKPSKITDRRRGIWDLESFYYVIQHQIVLKLLQIKSNHFYCHITTAQVPWWVKFLWACSRQCKKTTNNLHMDRQCKKKQQTIYIWTDSAKKNNLHMDRQCKKLHWSIYSAPDSAKKQQQFTYGQTVQKNNKQFTYGQTVQKNNKQFTYGQTVQKSNSNLHMDSTYLQTVQKTMCKIHIHILSTLSVL